MRLSLAIAFMTALVIGGCGEAPPDTEWTQEEVIEAAGLEFERETAGGTFVSPGGCSVSGEPDIYTSREDLVEGLDPIGFSDLDVGDEDAIREAAAEDEVAVNPDLTAGVNVVGITTFQTGAPATETEPEDCIPLIEEGLAELGDN